MAIRSTVRPKTRCLNEFSSSCSFSVQCCLAFSSFLIFFPTENHHPTSSLVNHQVKVRYIFVVKTSRDTVALPNQNPPACLRTLDRY